MAGGILELLLLYGVITNDQYVELKRDENTINRIHRSES